MKLTFCAFLIAFSCVVFNSGKSKVVESAGNSNDFLGLRDKVLEEALKIITDGKK